MDIRIKALDQSLLQDFFALHTQSNEAGWCHCVAWWVPTWDAWAERTAAENRRLREELFDRGEFDGYLAYLGAQVVGWVQAGPRDRLEKLTESYGLEKDPAVFAVTCFLIAAQHRRKGIARFCSRASSATTTGKRCGNCRRFPSLARTRNPASSGPGPPNSFSAKALRGSVVRSNVRSIRERILVNGTSVSDRLAADLLQGYDL